MDKKTLRRADLITSIVFFLFSVFVFVMSLQLLIRTFERKNDWYMSSGLVPMIVSVLLAICSIALFVRARRDGAKFDFLDKEHIKKFFKSRELKVAVTIIGMLAFYLFIMLRFVEEWIKKIFRMLDAPGWVRYYVPYAIVTFIYLFAFMIVFNEKSKENIIKSMLISLIASGLIAYLFGDVAMILLP